MSPRREAKPCNSYIFANDVHSSNPKHTNAEKTGHIPTGTLANELPLSIKTALEDYRLLKTLFNTLFFILPAILNIEIKAETKTAITLAAVITLSIAREIVKRITRHHKKRGLSTRMSRSKPMD